MTSINVYLSFNGNCREAMAFYQKCLGGELSIQTIGEAPGGLTMPKPMKDFVLHAVLTKENLVLMGSDLVGEQGLKKGNTVSLMLNCSTEHEIKEYYKKLSDGGARTQPVEQSFYGTLFGNLIDKFGNEWFLHCQRAISN